MTVFGLGLHLIVALFFAIHAVRQRREMYWLLILFSFPLLGSVAYFFAVYLPELRSSRSVTVATRAVAQALDPGRELREARRAYELTPTINNRLRLAEALLAAGDITAALAHYTESAQGPFASDPKLVKGLAAAQFAAGQVPESKATLEALFLSDAALKRHPYIALLYARVLAEENADGVREAFAVALQVATDAEPKCRFADWLSGQKNSQDAAQAQSLYAEIIKDSGHWHRHARSHNAEWLRRARLALEK